MIVVSEGWRNVDVVVAAVVVAFVILEGLDCSMRMLTTLRQKQVVWTIGWTSQTWNYSLMFWGVIFVVVVVSSLSSLSSSVLFCWWNCENYQWAKCEIDDSRCLLVSYVMPIGTDFYWIVVVLEF
jgi:hypothetical protein